MYTERGKGYTFILDIEQLRELEELVIPLRRHFQFRWELQSRA